MIKLGCLFLTLFASVSAFSMPCSETEESKKAINEEMQKISELDKSSGEQFKRALKNLQVVSQKDEKQMLAYATQVATKPELAPLQQQRQALGLKMMSLISGTDCEALKENNKKLREVISAQWIGVLTTVQADTQVYLVKKMGDVPDMKATTDSGKRVILRANGTWSEDGEN
jgi:hypothetical protein